MTGLSGAVPELRQELGVTEDEEDFMNNFEPIERVMTSWVAGKCGPEYPPTWHGLLRVLAKLGLQKLTQRMDDFLNGRYVCRFLLFLQCI